MDKKHCLLQTELITVHNPEARGNILHEMIQVFLHLPGIIYVKKRMAGPHSGTGPEWALLWAQCPQHVNLFSPQINIAQMSEKLDIYAQRMKNTQTLFFKDCVLKLSLPSQWKQGRMRDGEAHAVSFSFVFLVHEVMNK